MGSSKSKSSNTSNTTNVSGQNAISGDNLGVAISGVNNSTINTTMTDHGAVTAAMELGGEMLNSNERISLEAMDTTHDIAETAIDEVVDFAGSQAAQNSKNLEAMMDLAKFKQDGGQVETSKMMVVLAIVLVLVLGYVMVKKR
ncbi:chemotaxis protein [Vibrio alginolyticus]|uniref:chemotaxis protein n=1 Tax=Vibrio alginolyticus TaxID=663 RepID=UPI003D7C9FE8